MLHFFRKLSKQSVTRPTANVETLEDRQLLSVVPLATFNHFNAFQVGQYASEPLVGAHQSTVLYSAAPTAVQTGLTALAQGTTINASQKIRVHALSSGVTAYSTVLAINGQAVRIAVDSSGNPLAGFEQFGNTPSAVQTGLGAVASGVSISSTQLVQIRTLSTGTTIYQTTIVLNGATTRIAVDASGNPIQGTIQFSSVPSVVQTDLQSQATGVTIDPTTSVSIRTLRNGTTVYYMTVTISGKQTTIAADNSGDTVTPPSTPTNPNATTVLFSAAPAAVQTGLEALSAGVTIPDSQVVNVKTSATTTIYSTSVIVNGEKTTVTVDSTGKALAGYIAFSTAPSAMQTGLTTLANGTSLTATQLVQISTSRNGTTDYSTVVNVNGKTFTIAVDSTGAALTKSCPASHNGYGQGNNGGYNNGTESTIAFSAAPSAMQTALNSLAGTTIPATQNVQVRTPSTGAAVYSTVVAVNGALTAISVDANGNILDGVIAFSAAPSAVQTGLQALASSVTLDATQQVRVSTDDNGTTIYSTSINVNGNATVIAVNASGATVTSGRDIGPGGFGFGYGGGRYGRGF